MKLFGAFIRARMSEPSTWMGLAWLIQTLTNAPHFWSIETVSSVAGGVCGVVMKSPGAPWTKNN